MFRAYSGFENLPLRVEVQWRGAARPVVARLEQWPDSDKAVLVCNFEDEEDAGEWLIMRGNTPYMIARPDKWIGKHNQIDSVTGEYQEFWRFESSGIGKFRANVKRPFLGQDDFNLVRLLHFKDVPNEPRLVLESADRLSWYYEKNDPKFVPFTVEDWKHSFSFTLYQAQLQLRLAWLEPKSEVYFAWQWSTLSGGERLEKLTGSAAQREEVRRTMQLVLQQSFLLWQLDVRWSWMLGLNPDDLDINSYHNLGEQGKQILDAWNSLLRRHYYLVWGQDIFEAHPCARDFWGRKSRWLGYAQRASAPNFHEQLEAKLQLRDWLQDKATPAEIEQLLAT